MAVAAARANTHPWGSSNNMEEQFRPYFWKVLQVDRLLSVIVSVYLCCNVVSLSCCLCYLTICRPTIFAVLLSAALLSMLCSTTAHYQKYFFTHQIVTMFIAHTTLVSRSGQSRNASGCLLAS